MRRIQGMLGAALFAALAAGPLAAAQAEPVEVPLRIEDGRLMVTLDAPDGSEHDFVLGLGMPLLSESGAAAIGHALGSLTLEGVAFMGEGAQVVPDRYWGSEGPAPAGVLGGSTLNRYDVLIDAANGKMILKPLGRAVRWDGYSLSSPARMQVYHDVLARVDVSVGGQVFGALMDLSNASLEVNGAVAEAAGNADRTDSFRMGYAGWPDLPLRQSENPAFQGWDPEGKGFVILGAAIAYDCVIAVSWFHEEFRTCMR